MRLYEDEGEDLVISTIASTTNFDMGSGATNASLSMRLITYLNPIAESCMNHVMKIEPAQQSTACLRIDLCLTSGPSSHSGY